MRALIYVIDALSMLITFLFLLRFWLPWFGVDFRNPIAQGILRATTPVISPLRRIVPSIGRIDTATILFLFFVQAVTFLLIFSVAGSELSAKFILISAAFKLVFLSFRLFMFAIIIRIVLSWIAPQTHSPATALLADMTDPLLRPFRRYIPTIGGFDISPVFAIIMIGALSMLVMDLQAYVM